MSLDNISQPSVKLIDALAAYRNSELTTSEAHLNLTVGGPRPVEKVYFPKRCLRP